MESTYNRKALVNALAVTIPVAKRVDLSRSHLRGLYFDTEGEIVATDGHTLVAAQTGNPLNDAVFLPLHEAVTLLAVAKANKAVDMHTVALTPDQSGAEDFPPWKKVIPSGTEPLEEPIAFNPAYLLEAARAARATSKYLASTDSTPVEPAIVMRFHGELAPVVFTVGVGCYEHSVRIVIMPKRLG